MAKKPPRAASPTLSPAMLEQLSRQMRGTSILRVQVDPIELDSGLVVPSGAAARRELAAEDFKKLLHDAVTKIVFPYVDNAISTQSVALKERIANIENSLRGLERDYRIHVVATQDMAAVRRAVRDLEEKVAKGVRVYAPATPGKKRRYSPDD